MGNDSIEKENSKLIENIMISVITAGDKLVTAVIDRSDLPGTAILDRSSVLEWQIYRQDLLI